MIINLLGCAAALFDIHFLVADTDEAAYNGVKRRLGVNTFDESVKTTCSTTDIYRLCVLSGSRPVIACRNRLCGSCVYSLGCCRCVHACCCRRISSGSIVTRGAALRTRLRRTAAVCACIPIGFGRAAAGILRAALCGSCRNRCDALIVKRNIGYAVNKHHCKQPNYRSFKGFSEYNSLFLFASFFSFDFFGS